MLSERERTVVNHYIKSLNKAESLRRAGYSESMCDNPQQVFGRPHVQAEIDRRFKIMTTKANVNAEYVLNKWIEIVEADIGTLVEVDPKTGQVDLDLSRLSEEQKRAIAEFQVETYKKGRGEDAVPVVKLRVKPHDKMRALESLAKYLGMYKEKLEIEGELDIGNRIMLNRRRMGQDVGPEENKGAENGC